MCCWWLGDSEEYITWPERVWGVAIKGVCVCGGGWLVTSIYTRAPYICMIYELIGY